MPGYSIDRFPDLSAEDRDEYTCSICHEIFHCPVSTTCCLQTFCEDCITAWLQTNRTCPYDRKPLTASKLSQAPRVMVNTLGRFKIQCDFWDNGCREVNKLEDLARHVVNCAYDPTKCAKCRCEQTSGHDCIQALRELINKLMIENEALKVNHHPDHGSNMDVMARFSGCINSGQMPGYNSDRFPDLSAEDRDEYTCSICQEIFNTPVTTTCCLQTFCEDCITQWLQTNNSCPYDRKPLSRDKLSRPPRVMMNTLGRFKIRCDFWDIGCCEVVKLESLTSHTVICRYNNSKCLKCQCERTSGHNCIDALLKQNRQIMSQNEVLKTAYRSLQNDRGNTSDGARSLSKPGKFNKLLSRVESLNITTNDHDGNGDGQAVPALPDSQILAECRRHLSEPLRLDSQMRAHMTDKTMSIVKQQLMAYNSVDAVCKHVCEQLELEYGTDWHCIIDPHGHNRARYNHEVGYYMCVKFGQTTLTIFHTNRLDWTILKARIKHNKIAPKLNILYTDMNASMVSAVTAIVFEVIHRSDSIGDTVAAIKVEMDSRYPPTKWQCFAYSKDSGNRVVSYRVGKYIESYVGQLHVIIFQALQN
ncbi:unnamed protein product [Medioppia subpectinata]|uniref:RING-type domain-containing protein n=1 Tax=Medioppia subpectinata TaxID=1979941 RepID=A0A7R9KIS0_9ACAR|nr:unnamed protein product [Medioppia subpectinata]CAG2102923.1 unnamed protein product [Medioppia subpectinata]